MWLIGLFCVDDILLPVAFKTLEDLQAIFDEKYPDSFEFGLEPSGSISVGTGYYENYVLYVNFLTTATVRSLAIAKCPVVRDGRWDISTNWSISKRVVKNGSREITTSDSDPNDATLASYPVAGVKPVNAADKGFELGQIGAFTHQVIGSENDDYGMNSYYLSPDDPFDYIRYIYATVANTNLPFTTLKVTVDTLRVVGVFNLTTNQYLRPIGPDLDIYYARPNDEIQILLGNQLANNVQPFTRLLAHTANIASSGDIKQYLNIQDVNFTFNGNIGYEAVEAIADAPLDLTKATAFSLSSSPKSLLVSAKFNKAFLLNPVDTPMQYLRIGGVYDSNFNPLAKYTPSEWLIQPNVEYILEMINVDDAKNYYQSNPVVMSLRGGNLGNRFGGYYVKQAYLDTYNPPLVTKWSEAPADSIYYIGHEPLSGYSNNRRAIWSAALVGGISYQLKHDSNNKTAEAVTVFKAEDVLDAFVAGLMDSTYRVPVSQSKVTIENITKPDGTIVTVVTPLEDGAYFIRVLGGFSTMNISALDLVEVSIRANQLFGVTSYPLTATAEVIS